MLNYKMPKVTPGRNYLKRYTEEDLEKAIQAVGNGMPKKTAAVKYNVPRPTLQFRLSNNFVKSRPGPSTVLTVDEETALVNWIIISSRKGFPRRREDLIKSVKEFLDKNPRENPFIDNTPGEGWYKLFMKRHPEITERTSEAVTSASSKVSENQIRKWFKQIEDYMKENNLMHIFDEPSRILNGDETNFILCPKNTKVLAPKGEKNIYEVDHAQAKSCVTVMFTFSANGKVTPPMIIFPLKKMRQEIRRSVPEEWGIGLSDNGWMQAATFFQYIKNVLHPALVKDGVEFPVILFVDGHKSHTTLEMSQLCQNLGIVLVALYPNATRILQPADVAAFRPVKTLWRKAVLEWRINNISKTMLKTDVGPILKVLLPKIKAETVKNGFRATGLCPFNPDVVDYSKCLVRSKEVYQQDPATSKRSLSREEFHKIIGPDLARKMKNQLIAPSKEAKILYDVYKYFSAIQKVDPKVTEEHEPTEEREETLTADEIIEEREDPVWIEEREHEITEKREEPVTKEEGEESVTTEDKTEFEITKQRREPEVTRKIKLPKRETHNEKVKEKLERKDTPDTIEDKEPKMKMEKKLLENIIQSDKIEPETAAKKDKYNMTREKQEYELHTERELLEEIDATEHETEENQETGRTLVIVPEKIKDKCIVNSTDKKEISNIELILQDGDVPEPAQNLEMTAEIYKEPNRLTTYSPQPSTSREDVVFIDGKWVRIPIDEIPVTIPEESPVKKSLVFSKTPIKKGRLNQEARTFVLTEDKTEFEITKHRRELEITRKRKLPEMETHKEKVEEKLERKDTPGTVEGKEPKIIKEKNLPKNTIQSDKREVAENIDPKTAVKKEKCKMTRERTEYEFDKEHELIEEIHTTEHETEENEDTGRNLITVPEKIKDKCIVNIIDKREISNTELILQDGDVPEPAQNLEITTEIYEEPNRLTTCSPQPSTCRQDIIFIHGKWVPIDEIPVTIAKESPVKKTLSQFLVLPKTPIKKGRLNQEARTFVLTSKAWEEEEIKKQNKKNEEMQTKEEKKKQRLKKAEETRLNKERKQAENLKKKVIKTESQKNKDAKNNAKKPKIIQNVLIKPANENTINVQQTRHSNTRVKEEKNTDKEEMQGNDTRIHQKYIKLERKKDRKDLMPLTDKQLLNILEDNHK